MEGIGSLIPNPKKQLHREPSPTLAMHGNIHHNLEAKFGAIIQVVLVLETRQIENR